MKTPILITTFVFIAAAGVQAQEILDAVRANDLARVAALIRSERKVVDTRDADGRSPLHWACRSPRLDLVQVLVEHGADVQARDTSGNTPLHVAAQTGRTEVVRFLLDRGATPSPGNQTGFTPLLFAVQANHLETAQVLVSRGAEIDVVLRADYYGLTPVSFGIANGNLDMVRMLLRSGAKLRHRTRLGENYLHVAAALNRADIAAFLIAGGIEVDAVKNGGLTPLHLAAVTGSLEVARLLVQKGANLHLRCRDGATPLHLAVAGRQTETADFLRRSGARDLPREFPVYRGRYLGQRTPGTNPEPFLPDLFRDIYRSYSVPVFSPDGREVFWYGYLMPRIGYSRIWTMREEQGRWTAPELAPFSDHPSWSPALSPDGRRIIFASERPKEGPHSDSCDLWYADKGPDGRWGEARPLGSPPNRGDFNEMAPIPAEDGAIYFKAFGPGARGTQLYRSRRVGGAYLAPQSVDDLIDGDVPDECAGIDHVITYAYGGPKGAEISICFRRPDGRWTPPVSVGDLVHRGQGTSGGALSPDRRYFFFVQNISPYWVDASFLDDLRRETLKRPPQNGSRKSAEASSSWTGPTGQARQGPL